MRIEFPHSARDDFLWTGTLLRVGSAADNDLVLATTQAAPQHLRIEQDRRGWVLQVLPGALRVYVNARPVRERALLRAGDMLSVGDCRMRLCADACPVDRSAPTCVPAARDSVALRARAGTYSGRVLPVGNGIELGAFGRWPLDLPQGESAGFKLGWQAGQLVLDATTGSVNYPLRVNGIAVNHAILQPGDQLSLGSHRFVLDAPGMRLEPVPPPPPVPAPAVVEAAGPHGELGWLIVTAVLLALAIGWALWWRF
ncbi:MAG: FHA domain-containing protein [Rhodanobacter sp.]|nr:MAG: FHA domain-containing protein [Rhodanobacter sp.]TAM13657.1 MAG: FHA domain-containing protein [Rhodanobacter sp.]TAM35589.1 MAG: FHA domain-containing protein [Rhodanobacter sp.]